MRTLSKRPSFPRRQKSTPQVSGLAAQTSWIPAFAGMTALEQGRALPRLRLTPGLNQETGRAHSQNPVFRRLDRLCLTCGWRVIRSECALAGRLADVHRPTKTTLSYADRQMCQVNTTPLDRHRGGGHPPTPATPPCVRDRTRRFELVALIPIEQSRKSERVEVCIGKPYREGFGSGKIPGTPSAAGRVTGQARTSPQLQQSRSPTTRGFPLPPQSASKS